MKAIFLIGLGLAISLPAQTPESAATTQTAPSVQVLRSEAELNTLLGPIALYPDSLIALILPAATSPSDIVLAARSLGTNASTETLATQSWDDSVKALTHYPDLLRWLDQNLSWTQAVGEAFTAQPADVMNTVQRLRQQARAAGTLVDTPQQRIVNEGDSLLITPTESNVVYVPVYDPTVVYVSRPALIGHRYVSFRYGSPTGPWLNYRLNWHQRNVCVTPRPLIGIYYNRHPSLRSPDRQWVPSPTRIYSPNPTTRRPQIKSVQPQPEDQWQNVKPAFKKPSVVPSYQPPARQSETAPQPRVRQSTPQAGWTTRGEQTTSDGTTWQKPVPSKK